MHYCSYLEQPLPILPISWEIYKKFCPRILKKCFITGNPMVFSNYDKDISESTIENNGHAIQIEPKPQSYSSKNPPPTISKGE